MLAETKKINKYIKWQLSNNSRNSEKNQALKYFRTHQNIIFFSVMEIVNYKKYTNLIFPQGLVKLRTRNRHQKFYEEEVT